MTHILSSSPHHLRVRVKVHSLILHTAISDTPPYLVNYNRILTI